MSSEDSAQQSASADGPGAAQRRLGRRLNLEVMFSRQKELIMAKHVVNEDEYIEVCNEELKKHDYYKEGMEITGVPEGGSGSDMSGYSWKGPDTMAGIVSQVVAKVNEKYELRVTQR
jgi:hypothetical protein